MAILYTFMIFLFLATFLFLHKIVPHVSVHYSRTYSKCIGNIRLYAAHLHNNIFLIRPVCIFILFNAKRRFI